MWRDELQAWLLARDSHSIPQLFSNLRYDGHPGLWHLLLYIVTCFTHNPVYTQVLHFLLACGFVFVFIRYAEIKTLYKIMILAGYLPLYEYSVISRCYALSLLLIFLCCTFYKERTNRYLAIGICLALLANSNVYGAIMAIGLAGILFLDYFIIQETKKRKWLPFIGGLLITTIGLALAVYQIIPKKGNSFPVDYPNGLTDVTRWLSSWSRIFTSYMYVPSTEDIHFWNTNYYFDKTAIIGNALWPWLQSHHEYLAGWIIMPTLIMLLSILLFLRKKLILLFYVVLTLTFVCFSYYTNLSFMRYAGFLWITFICSYWLSTYYQDDHYKNSILNKLIPISLKIEKPFLLLLFSVNIMGSVVAYEKDFENDFSTSKLAADYLKEKQLDKLPYVGSSDFIVSPITAYLDNKMYYPDMKAEGSFCIWSSQRSKSSELKDLTKSIDSMIAKGNSKIVMVLNIPFYTKSPEGTRKLVLEDQFTPHSHLQFEKIIEPGIVEDETYAIYILTKQEADIRPQAE